MSDNTTDIHRYDDIIKLPHHVSSVHPHMPISDRAAQFAPFAALTGHGEAIKETARLTDKRVELDENAKAILDEKLRMVQEMLAQNPEITVTYFQPDEKKAGGQYRSATGSVKKIDLFNHLIVMTDGLRLPLSEVFEIEGDIFGYADYV